MGDTLTPSEEGLVKMTAETGLCNHKPSNGWSHEKLEEKQGRVLTQSLCREKETVNTLILAPRTVRE